MQASLISSYLITIPLFPFILIESLSRPSYIKLRVWFEATSVVSHCARSFRTYFASCIILGPHPPSLSIPLLHTLLFLLHYCSYIVPRSWLESDPFFGAGPRTFGPSNSFDSQTHAGLSHRIVLTTVCHPVLLKTSQGINSHDKPPANFFRVRSTNTPYLKVVGI